LKIEESGKLPVIEYKFKPKSGLIRLVALGCLHVGHRNFMREYAQGFVEYVRKTPDTYAILMADTCENVLPETVARFPGVMYDQVMDVEQQREEAIKLLSPIQNKILFALEGNHSLRSWYASGFSVERHIAEALGVPFPGIEVIAKIGVHNQHYTMNATHGTGSTSSPAAVFGKLLAQSSRVHGVDVVVRSHHHHKGLFETTVFDGETGEQRKVLLAATGCFMGYLNSYGHRKGMKPIVPGAIKIKLYSEKRDIHATL